MCLLCIWVSFSSYFILRKFSTKVVVFFYLFIFFKSICFIEYAISRFSNLHWTWMGRFCSGLFCSCLWLTKGLAVLGGLRWDGLSQFHVIYSPHRIGCFCSVSGTVLNEHNTKATEKFEAYLLSSHSIYIHYTALVKASHNASPEQGLGKWTLHFFIDFQRQKGKNKGEREKYQFVVWLICVHWLILLCALTGDHTHSFCASGWRCNQLSYSARTRLYFLMKRNSKTT